MFEPSVVISRKLSVKVDKKTLCTYLFSFIILEYNVAQSADFYHQFLPKQFVIIRCTENPRKIMTEDRIQIPCLDKKALMKRKNLQLPTMVGEI